MRSLAPTVLYLALVQASVWCSPVLPAAGQESFVFSPDDYFGVVDVLFRTEPKTDAPELRLQYLFERSGESQIVIRSRPGGGWEVETWELPNGSPSIDAQLDRFAAERLRPSIEAIAKRISVVRELRTVDQGSPLGRTVAEGYAMRIPLVVGSATAHLHAPTWRFQVRSLAARLSIEFEPVPAGRPEDVLVRWMERLRTEVRRFAAPPGAAK
jgi:hypothetical protein